MTLWVYDDGGRGDAGYRGTAGDCVVRAIAIAARLPYQQVYDELSASVKQHPRVRGVSARDGVPRTVYHPYLEALGWELTPTMQIGSGCQVHVRRDELPDGRLILSLSKHYAAFVNGTLRDIYDCSRDGTRCVYGYWRSKAWDLHNPPADIDVERAR